MMGNRLLRSFDSKSREVPTPCRLDPDQILCENLCEKNFPNSAKSCQIEQKYENKKSYDSECFLYFEEVRKPRGFNL